MPERKKRTEEQRRLARRLAEKDAIIDGISDVLMVLDSKTYEIREVNRAFLDSYGLSRQEVIGKKCYEVTHQISTPCYNAQDPCPCPIKESVETGKVCHTEHAHPDREGTPIYFEVSTYPLTDGEGNVTRVIHLSRDVTQRRRLEFQLREREKLNGILEVAGGASHEINQPLTVIISGLEQLERRLPTKGRERDMARTILDHARRLSKVSEKLAGITRYASKEYVSGSRIIDLDEASHGGNPDRNVPEKGKGHAH